MEFKYTSSEDCITMNFLFANAHELAAMMELPWIQRVTYLMGIRPYMDRKTNTVGIKRKISYQSLREILYVGPIAGVKTGAPSRQQVKRAVKSLERAGLIEINSSEHNLILKCPLAALDNSTQKQADLKPTLQADTNPTSQNIDMVDTPTRLSHKPDMSDLYEADPPQNSEKDNVFIIYWFEKFWKSYPQKIDKNGAFYQFKQLNPDKKLFEDIMSGLERQIEVYEYRKSVGDWLPNWKYPRNWLVSERWRDFPEFESGFVLKDVTELDETDDWDNELSL